MASDGGESEGAEEESGLFADFGLFGFEENGRDGEDFGVDHLVSGFLNRRKIVRRGKRYILGGGLVHLRF